MSLNLRDMSAEQHLDSFVVKQFKESRADVRIFPLGELRALFNHGHIRSEPPYRLREFKAYIAAANHYEMTWLTIEIERLDMGHRIRRGEPWEHWASSSANPGRGTHVRRQSVECRHR